MRLAVIKEYMLKGILPIDDLLMSINCVPVDCDTLDKCKCRGTVCGEPTAHFQIPQIIFDYGLNKSIKYIGSSDKQHSFLVYTKSIDKVQTYQKYRKRGKINLGFIQMLLLIRKVYQIVIFLEPLLFSRFLLLQYLKILDNQKNFSVIVIKQTTLLIWIII